MPAPRLDEGGVVAFELSRRVRAGSTGRLGPYERAYDTRSGYDSAPVVQVDDREVMLFRGREPRRR